MYLTTKYYLVWIVCYHIVKIFWSRYNILQKFAENYDNHLESLKSELNLLPRTIQQYELKNNIKINHLIQLTEMVRIYKLVFIEFYKLCSICAACERTFSCLRQNYLTNSMLNERSCDFGIIHVEKINCQNFRFSGRNK